MKSRKILITVMKARWTNPKPLFVTVLKSLPISSGLRCHLILWALMLCACLVAGPALAQQPASEQKQLALSVTNDFQNELADLVNQTKAFTNIVRELRLTQKPRVLGR